ncbi:MAG: bifunctional phosphoribosylaminoimidazolecarboxamide formyltransferase/inosine monophosphate cyclohydrolase [Planctomycetaceae bacterium]|nr:bifunctional phosphoribosylaminoimidazolecarboxamide formyltransferase/inosine monophosphate cyclohydrolase [Planctomycetaceae bacterium]
MSSPPIKRALISVSDKLGLVDFAQGLEVAGVEIYSTGGTRRHLEQSGIEVLDVAEYTGFPEMMDGRVKTLHPRIFAGILCRHDREDDMASLEKHDILSFELVVVNLYPFEATIAKPGVTRDQAIEQIDIGGPSLVRAAAKNAKFTSIVTNPEQYSSVLEEVTQDGCTSQATRDKLSATAFAMTAEYDQAISRYFAESETDSIFKKNKTVSMQLKNELRYGENPHQQAAIYSIVGSSGVNVINAQQLNGKELSYNNLLDLDAALHIVRPFTEPACSVIKHNNPCGAATGESLAEATRKAMAGDPLSAFGSILSMNRVVDEQTAELLSEPGLFVEAIVAPDFSAAAIDILTTKPKWRNNVRLMQVGNLDDQQGELSFRHINGGMLVQEADVLADDYSSWEVVTEVQPDEVLLDELKFAWQMVRHIKSNAIAVCREQSLVGAGAGQMSRVDSVEIAIRKAGERTQGAVLSSDAFFPFPDSIHAAAEAGITAIIQPGGSRGDESVTAACNEHGIPMIFTGRRHFKH